MKLLAIFITNNATAYGGAKKRSACRAIRFCSVRQKYAWRYSRNL